MKTYLIFFGKSQDFNFHVFDENGCIENFDTVIKDFDLLESKVFSVDDISNEQILAKYNFSVSNGRSFSLLKLYSFAQASSGNRIVGSIYGVALLSEHDLLLDIKNLNLLKALKEKFTELCLTGMKFNNSNFHPEAEAIWEAFKKNDYFKVISLDGIPYIAKDNNPRGFLVENIFSKPAELNEEIKKNSRLYFSSDLEHLKRTRKKWPNIFTFEIKDKTKYTAANPDASANSSEIADSDDILYLQSRITTLTSEKDRYAKDNRALQKKQKKTKTLSLIIGLLFVVSLFFNFRPYFMAKGGNNPLPPATKGLTPQIPAVKIDTNTILSFLIDGTKAEALGKLCTSVNKVRKTTKSQDSLINYKAIRDGLGQLGLDSNLVETFTRKPSVTVKQTNEQVNPSAPKKIKKKKTEATKAPTDTVNAKPAVENTTTENVDHTER